MLGPSCHTLNTLSAVKHFKNWYDSNYITHFKVFKNIESIIFFLNHLSEINPKFFFNVGYRWENSNNECLKNLKEYSHTINTTYYHFDLSDLTKEDIDILWHFGNYKKYIDENTNINCDIFIASLMDTLANITTLFLKQRKAFLESTDKTEKRLFVRCETFEDLENHKNISEKHLELLNAICHYGYSDCDFRIIVPKSSVNNIDSEIDKRISYSFIPSDNYKRIMNYDSWRLPGIITEEDKGFINECFKDIELEQKRVR